MKSTAKTTAGRDDAAAATFVAAAQRALDVLLAEQRALPAEIARTGRAGDAGRYAQLLLRRDNLPIELEQAQMAVTVARLDEMWKIAEDLVGAEARARLARDTTAAAYDEYKFLAGQPKSATDIADSLLSHARLRDDLTAAQTAHRDAESAAAAALYEIDHLEDAVELATGERPAPGEGLRATPGELQSTFILAPPSDGGGYKTWETEALIVGTVPPRWAAFLLTHSRDAWAKGEA